MPESEDLRRYTAPPDNPSEERTYTTSDITNYIKSWFPDSPKNSANEYPAYSLCQVRFLLKEAIADIKDEDHGIDTI